MKSIKNILSLMMMVSACALTSCDIERLPTSSVATEEITDDPEESLEALMNGCYAQLKEWSDPMHRLGEYAGDNMMIRGTSTDAFYEFISYSRTPDNYRLQNFWDYGYKAIAQASNIINMIEEGTSTEIDNELGECYYIRGMMYFYLCRAFGRPYYQSPETNLGVPIVNGTPDDMENLSMPDRSTVEETYAQAISDLEKAEELMTINDGPIYASKEAAEAMLSRVYIYMSGTYSNPNTEYAQKAVEYATKVIDSGEYSLLPRETFMTYNTILPEENEESIFVIKRLSTEFTSTSDYTSSIGSMYASISGVGWGEMYASAKYLDLLDETGRNDWRESSFNMVDARAYFIDPQYTEDDDTEVFRFVKNEYDSSTGEQTGYNYVQAPITRNSGGLITCTEDGEEIYTLNPVDEEQEIYTIDYEDGNTYKGVIDNIISLNRVYPMFYIMKCSNEGDTGTHLHSPIISRLGEIYLNRAEGYAKMGNYSAALSDLNTIRERSIPDGGYSSLDASNAGDRIDKERQLELAFQAERSYDVYRNGEALTRQYPGPHDSMEIIEPDDYRVVYYIPQDAIDSYPDGSTLTQNPTSN